MSVKLEHAAGGTTTIEGASTATPVTITLPATTGTAALTSDVIGVGQTWQDGLASDLDGQGIRAATTVYTNNSGKPIQLAITVYNANAQIQDLYINAKRIARAYGGAPQVDYSTWCPIVPAGDTYNVTIVTAGGTILEWMELR